MRAYVRARVRVCVRVCARVCVRVCVLRDDCCSDRKRMSVVVRKKGSNKIKLMCKGAVRCRRAKFLKCCLTSPCCEVLSSPCGGVLSIPCCNDTIMELLDTL